MAPLVDSVVLVYLDWGGVVYLTTASFFFKNIDRLGSGHGDASSLIALCTLMASSGSTKVWSGPI